MALMLVAVFASSITWSQFTFFLKLVILFSNAAFKKIVNKLPAVVSQADVWPTSEAVTNTDSGFGLRKSCRQLSRLQSRISRKPPIDLALTFSFPGIVLQQSLITRFNLA